MSKDDEADRSALDERADTMRRREAMLHLAHYTMADEYRGKEDCTAALFTRAEELLAWVERPIRQTST